MLNVKSKMARGAAWMILFKWVERGLGFISTLILVRLLTPEDFGMVAMALSFVFMAELLTAFSFDIALIQNKSATADHFNSAWTADILMGATIALIMWVLAFPISEFYGHPELVLMVKVLAFGPLFIGLQNIGIVVFRKELDFHKEFVFQVSQKLIGFTVTISLAVLYRSYWALVIGSLAAKLGGTLLSYWVQSFRPRFSLKMIGSLLHFSRWLLLNNFVNFFKNRSTDFFLGRMSGPASLGTFNVSNEFASIPANEVGMPINRALMPGFAKMQDDPEGVRQSFRMAVALLALIAVPMGVGLYAVTPLMVPVLLGDKWFAAIPVMQLLSLNSAILVFHGTIVTLLIAIGKPREATKVNFFFVVILLVGLFSLTESHGAVGAAIAVLVATVISTPIYLIQVRRNIGEGFMGFFSAVVRPTIASIVMIFAVSSILPAYDGDLPAIKGIMGLIVAIATGGAVYLVTLSALWWVFGKDRGAERLVLDKITLRYDALILRVRSH